MGAASFAAENARRIKEHRERINGISENANVNMAQGDLIITSDDAGKKRYQLLQMNKPELVAYSKEIGLLLDDTMKKEQMIELIQQREQEM